MAETENKPNGSKTQEKKQLEFEKYKLNVELVKWFLGSFLVGLLIFYANNSFQDRAVGLEEIKHYDKYLTELLVLNKDVAQKRMLAQFFSNVTPSKQLRKGWCDYYEIVDKEYQEMIARINKENERIEDEIKKDSSSTTKDSLMKEIEKNNKKINPELLLPGKSYDEALEWEYKGFTYLLDKKAEDAISAFRKSEDVYISFHQVYEIANYLAKNKSNLTAENQSEWKKAYQKILSDYSWKMPEYVRDTLAARTK
jgi:hypothetical protein